LEEYATLSGQYMSMIFDQFQSWLGFDNNSYLICIFSHTVAPELCTVWTLGIL